MVPSYPLTRWQLNFRYFTIQERARAKLPKIVLTCRIDGPTAAVAKRIVEDAIKTEAAGGPKGLPMWMLVGSSGTKLLTSQRPPMVGSIKPSVSLPSCSRRKFRTTLNNVDELFPPGNCPRAALYCGWYALQNYTPAFELMPGSIAIHVASFEAVSLREKDNRRWVPNLLQDGACVTLGPVQEPYLMAFPKPNHLLWVPLRWSYGGGKLLAELPVHQLADHDHRRPALSALWEGASHEVVGGEALASWLSIPATDTEVAAHLPPRLHASRHERHQRTIGPAPDCLCCQHRSMTRQMSPGFARTPVEALFVTRQLLRQSATRGVALRRAAVVQHPAGRFIQAAVARRLQPSAYFQIVEVGDELFGKATHLQSERHDGRNQRWRGY